MFILDNDAPEFNPSNPFYAEQLQKGLTTNVFYQGFWGFFHSMKFVKENFEYVDLDFQWESNQVIPDVVAVDFEEENKVDQVQPLKLGKH